MSKWASILKEKAASAPPAVVLCATCTRPLDQKSRCWHCCNRVCSGCGRPTGSAFIELCYACGLADTSSPS
jgi:hypothetical protein